MNNLNGEQVDKNERKEWKEKTCIYVHVREKNPFHSAKEKASGNISSVYTSLLT
jgi:hypothetical protein